MRFLPPILLILAFQPISFHTVVTVEEFFKKSRAELFDCGVANDMSKVTHMLMCIMSTPCHVFVLLGSVQLDCFGSFKN